MGMWTIPGSKSLWNDIVRQFQLTQFFRFSKLLNFTTMTVKCEYVRLSQCCFHFTQNTLFDVNLNLVPGNMRLGGMFIWFREWSLAPFDVLLHSYHCFVTCSVYFCSRFRFDSPSFLNVTRYALLVVLVTWFLFSLMPHYNLGFSMKPY